MLTRWPLPELPVFAPRSIALGALLVLALFALAARAVRRRRSVPAGAWVELTLEGALTELATPQPWWRAWVRVGAEAPRSVYALREPLERLARDPKVAGLLVRLGPLSCGWSTAQAARELLELVRAQGKRVVVFLPAGGGAKELLVASGGDAVYATPPSSIAPVGVASGQTFFKKLLARGGVEAEVLARREFKSAAESFVREGYSDENKLQLEALLDAVYLELVRALATHRKVDEARARAWIDGAPYRAPEALEQGLLDGVCYDDELAGVLGTTTAKRVAFGRYAVATAPGFLARRKLARRGRVGVVEVRGPIVYEAQGALGRVADVRGVTAALRAAGRDPSLRAVVLYVDSPGGSALASDLLAREVARLDEKKPVLAYFANVAASGGYYIAAPARELIARPLAVTGSIGVVLLRFVVEGALEKLGLSHEVVRRGARADATSPYRKWTDEERALFDREIDGLYADFVRVVARGRRRPEAEIEPLARGRVYAARDAHAVGLVDQLGGLSLAISRAASLAGVEGAARAVVVPPPKGMPPAPEAPAAAAALLERLGARTAVLDLALNAQAERVFAWEDRTID